MRRIIFIILLVLMGCTSLVRKKGDVLTEHMEDSTIFHVKTSSNGIFYYSFNDQIYKILPDSEIYFYKNGNIDFKYGDLFVAFYDDITLKFMESFVSRSPEWGQAQFFKIKTNFKVLNLSSKVKLRYLYDNKIYKSEKIDLHKLDSSNNLYKYYGFFVSYNVFEQPDMLLAEVELFSNDHNMITFFSKRPVIKKDFEKQKIYFPKNKKKSIGNRAYLKYREEHKIRKNIWKDDFDGFAYGKSVFHPFKINKRITSEFGLKRQWIGYDKKVYRESVHLGVDYGAPKNTEVYSPLDGVVKYAQYGDLIGNTIIIDHGYSLFTDYSHLNKILVKVGDSVKSGDLIGYVGATGASTGPHLHWGARVHEMPVDPRFIFSLEGFMSDF